MRCITIFIRYINAAQLYLAANFFRAKQKAHRELLDNPVYYILTISNLLTLLLFSAHAQKKSHCHKTKALFSILFRQRPTPGGKTKRFTQIAESAIWCSAYPTKLRGRAGLCNFCSIQNKRHIIRCNACF